jgi:hypothetical protein
MLVSNGREQGNEQTNQRDCKDAERRLGGVRVEGEDYGIEESNETSDPNSSRGNLSREKSSNRGHASSGGMLRHLKGLKESLTAHLDKQNNALKTEISKNEDFRREITNIIDVLESQISGVLEESQDK